MKKRNFKRFGFRVSHLVHYFYFSKNKPNRGFTEYSFRLENVTTTEFYSCGFLFADTGMSDTSIGIFLFVFSIVVMVICLTILVRMLKSLLKEKLAQAVIQTLDKEIPCTEKFPWLSRIFVYLSG